MKKLFLVFWSLFLTYFSLSAQTVGLVLSGGGAKGIAHIGLLKALEENNIPIDYIAGTSMGAIVGALYAMGYTPDEMLELIDSDDFRSWLTGKIDEKYIYYFRKPEPSPEIVSFKIGIRDSSKISSHFLPQSIINPLPMNYAFMTLFSPSSAHAKNNFDNLFVPFRAVASDVYNKRPVIFRNGDLGDAVRASMSYPFVFKPLEMNGVLIYDGGIYNNFPVDVMKTDFNPDVIIGSVVSDTLTKPNDINPLSQIENMVMQKTNYSIDEEDGILLSFKLSDIGLLDFHKAEQISQIGYDGAMAIMDSIKQRIPREMTQETRAVNRAVYKTQLPDLTFNSVSVEGGNSAQRSYIRKQFDLDNDNLENEEVKKTYFKLVTDSKIEDLIPHAVYNEETEMFDLNLKAKMSDNIIASLGGFITSSSSNQVYLGAQYRTLGKYSTDFNINGEFGQMYNSAMASARFEMPSSIPMHIKLMYVFSNHKYYENEKLFYTTDSPTFIRNLESFGKLRFSLPFLTNSKTEVSVGYGYLYDKYYQSNAVDFSKTKADQSKYYLGMESIKFEKNTLNSYMYPSSGGHFSLSGKVVLGKERYIQQSGQETVNETESENHSWIELNAKSEHYLNVSKKFTLGLKSEVVISSKNFYNNYTSTIIQAPAFTPTPQSQTVFNEAFRANQFVAAGVIPIWKIMNNFYLRTEFYGFVPIFEIKRNENNKPYYGKLLRSFDYLGEVSLVYQLPFASLSAYVNKYSYPSNNWNFGITLGILMFNPKFLD